MGMYVPWVHTTRSQLGTGREWDVGDGGGDD